MPQLYKVNPAVDGKPASAMGKQLDWFEVNFGLVAGPCANLTSSWNQGPNGAWPVFINTVESLGSLEVLGTLGSSYSLATGTTGNLVVRIATSGVGAETGLQTAIQALGTVATGNGSTSAPWSNVVFTAVTVTGITL